MVLSRLHCLIRKVHSPAPKCRAIRIPQLEAFVKNFFRSFQNFFLVLALQRALSQSAPLEYHTRPALSRTFFTFFELFLFFPGPTKSCVFSHSATPTCRLPLKSVVPAAGLPAPSDPSGKLPIPYIYIIISTFCQIALSGPDFCLFACSMRRLSGFAEYLSNILLTILKTPFIITA